VRGPAVGARSRCAPFGARLSGRTAAAADHPSAFLNDVTGRRQRERNGHARVLRRESQGVVRRAALKREAGPPMGPRLLRPGEGFGRDTGPPGQFGPVWAFSSNARSGLASRPVTTIPTSGPGANLQSELSCRDVPSVPCGGLDPTTSRATRSTGLTCSRGTDPDGSTHVQSCSRSGTSASRSSCTPQLFLRGLIHSDGCPSVEHGDEPASVRPEALHVPVATYRYSKRNTISIARRESVAMLDSFVGPKR